MQNSSNGQSIIDFINLHGAQQLALSLQQLHDWILYDSELVIDKARKDVLHDIMLLVKKLKEFASDKQ